VAHLLNTKMAGRIYAQSIGKQYEDMNLIIAQLGGGITLGFHDHGRIADWVYDDEGPMSPQRAGAIPTRFLSEFCYNSDKTLQQMKMYLCGQSGLTAYFETHDVRKVEKLIDEGSEEAGLVYEAMAYGVARSIGRLSICRDGMVDRIILTGGLAHSTRFTDYIVKKVSFIAPVSVIPGEHEMEALAGGALRVLNGEEDIHPYDVYPEGYSSIEEIIARPNYLAQ
jgi:butyrate kinase